jgi:protein-S-isoprenylcysteine O-methyltransferase Ste14
MVILVVLWVLFFISHSWLAANSVKAHAQKLLGKQFVFYRIAYNVFSLLFLSLILYVLVCRHQYNFLFKPTAAISLIADILLIAGLAIMLLAFRSYDLGEFTGIKQLAQKIHQPEKLMVTGLNRYVRNPLYTGIIVLVLGYFIYQPTYMNFVSLLIIYAYIYIGTRLEEKKLEQVFGHQYLVYKKQVKMLIPFVF